jgi:hypothetical protein
MGLVVTSDERSIILTISERRQVKTVKMIEKLKSSQTTNEAF